MADFIFTFGFGHTDPVTGESRAKCFARISVPDGADAYEVARSQMNATFGQQWAFCYESEEEAGVAKWGLREIGVGPIPVELLAILEEVYRPEAFHIWWGGKNGTLDWKRPVDVWRDDPKTVLAAAEALLGQVAT